MPLNSSRPERPSTIPLVPLLFLMGLLLHEQLLLGCKGHNDSSLITSPQECSALAQLAKQSNLSTNCNCTQQLMVNSSLEHCSAYGKCMPPSPTRQHFAGCARGSVDAPVSELYLSNMSLQGDLTWVTNFRHIKHLDVSLNNLSGEIPSAIWNLSKLTYVNLSFNSLSGHIPNFINDSAVVKYPLSSLDFSHNQIEGPFPQNLCTRFPNLTHLILSSNHLNGSSNFSLCHKLEVLDASFNQLQGSPFHHLQGPSSLKTLDLKHNLFNGSLPSFSRHFSQLVDLDVSVNHFTGKFGSENSSLPLNLSKLNVSHNNLKVGLSPKLIFRYGISCFWPNTACKGCFNYAVIMSPSPSPSPSVLTPMAVSHSPSQKRSDFSITHRLDAILGIIGGCIAGFFFITILTCIIINKRRQKSTWPLCPAKRPPPPFKHVLEVGPFSFESQSGTWVADVKDPSSVPVVIFEKPLMRLTFGDLLQATKSFNRDYEVGDGTGLVYACVLPGVSDADDAKVTIEVVEHGPSLSAEAAHAAFTAMGEIKHDNLVPLLGYCIVGEEKLLIYKHMEGGALEDALHVVIEEAPLPNASAVSAEDWNNIESWPAHNELGQSCVLDTSTSLDWETRHKIALGVARALAYLHNGCRQPIVHGALSSSCILLDASLTKAMVANYGGAWGLRRQLTPGYVAPECGKENAHMAASHLSKRVEHAHTSNGDVHTYTPKCDVYGVGVVLLELATGRRVVGNYGTASSTLVAWVRALKKGKRAEEAVDRRLPATSHAYVLEMIKVGSLCTADSPSKRPSMQQVVGLLKDLATH